MIRVCRRKLGGPRRRTRECDDDGPARGLVCQMDSSSDRCWTIRRKMGGGLKARRRPRDAVFRPCFKTHRVSIVQQDDEEIARKTNRRGRRPGAEASAQLIVMMRLFGVCAGASRALRFETGAGVEEMQQRRVMHVCTGVRFFGFAGAMMPGLICPQNGRDAVRRKMRMCAVVTLACCDARSCRRMVSASSGDHPGAVGHVRGGGAWACRGESQVKCCGSMSANTERRRAKSGLVGFDHRVSTMPRVASSRSNQASRRSRVSPRVRAPGT